MSTSEPDPFVLEEGRILAKKYRLLRPAGFGGMAELWVAQNEATAAEVCIKVLRPETTDQEGVERFRREAHAAARLSHRAIVRIFDFMELRADGQLTKSGEQPRALAIVMELLSGETLSEHLMRRGTLSVEEALDIAIPFCGALAHAHRAGIIHRDLKPDNIFLAKDPDGTLIPKVLDFGVSKLATPDATPLTAAGEMLGTPVYFSPEQAKGALKIDGRSDVFSAGTVLYVMLTGRNPFERESFHEIVEAVIGYEPPRIEGISDALADVLARAMAKDPAARQADATELSIALRKASGRRSLSESLPEIPVAPPVDTSDSLPTVARIGAASEPFRAEPTLETETEVAIPMAKRSRAVPIVAGIVALVVVAILVVSLRGSERPAATAASAGPTADPPPTQVATGRRIPEPSASEAATVAAPAPEPTEAVGGTQPASPKAAPTPQQTSTTRHRRPSGAAPRHDRSIAADPGF